MHENEFPTRPFLTLEVAQKLIAAGLDEAEVRGLNTVVVAVCDDGGRLIAFARQDDAEPAAIETSLIKARTAALFARDTREWKERLMGGANWVLHLPNMYAIEGGQVIKLGKHVLGGLAIGGGSGALDTEIATIAMTSVFGPRDEGSQ
jgi:uncharacterized protein GlcG (DUF336 family)